MSRKWMVVSVWPVRQCSGALWTVWNASFTHRSVCMKLASHNSTKGNHATTVDDCWWLKATGELASTPHESFYTFYARENYFVSPAHVFGAFWNFSSVNEWDNWISSLFISSSLPSTAVSRQRSYYVNSVNVEYCFSTLPAQISPGRVGF